MKKNYLLISLYLMATSLTAQLIDFETTPALDLTIDQSVLNNWQIGIPQKMLFDTAYSPVHAILTDTASNYLTNDSSSFQLSFELHYGTTEFSFWHKIDSEAGRDGGHVSYSSDGGQTWKPIVDGWGGEIVFPTEPYFALTGYNFYLDTDTLFNGLPGFSGTNTEWRKSTFEAQCIGVKKSVMLQVKFTFYSDSIDTDQEGWMIDDISLQSYGGCGSTRDLPLSGQVMVLPNPFTQSTLLQIEGATLNDASLFISNSIGQIVRVQEGISGQEILVERGKLPVGIYYYVLEQEGELLHAGSLVVVE